MNGSLEDERVAERATVLGLRERSLLNRRRDARAQRRIRRRLDADVRHAAAAAHRDFHLHLALGRRLVAAGLDARLHVRDARGDHRAIETVGQIATATTGGRLRSAAAALPELLAA